MKKKNWIIITILIIILIGVAIFFYFRNIEGTPSNDENNYEANRTSVTDTNTATSKAEQQQNPEENPPTPSTEITQGVTEPAPPIEEQIATFTTKIYSSDSARQNNISITCNTLNGTTVKTGETFSFCGTVGQASSSKGYQKADIFDKDGNKKKGLGGRKLSN